MKFWFLLLAFPFFLLCLRREFWGTAARTAHSLLCLRGGRRSCQRRWPAGRAARGGVCSRQRRRSGRSSARRSSQLAAGRAGDVGRRPTCACRQTAHAAALGQPTQLGHVPAAQGPHTACCRSTPAYGPEQGSQCFISKKQGSQAGQAVPASYIFHFSPFV